MKKYVFLILLLVPVFLNAEEMILTVDGAVDMGLEYSLSLKALETGIKSKKRVVDSVYNYLYPRINASLGLSRTNEGKSVSSLVPDPTSMVVPGVFDRVALMEAEISPVTLVGSIQADLALSPAMFDGIEAAKLDYKAGLLDKNEAEKRLVRDIKKSFYQLLLVKENLKLMDDILQTMNRRYDQTLNNYKSGYVPELVLLNTQVAYENMKPKRKELQTTYEKLLIMFKLNLGIDINTVIKPEGVIEIPGIDISRLPGEFSVYKRFDYMNASLLIEKIETGIKAKIHSSRYPSVILSASYNPLLPDPFNGDSWGAGWLDNWSDRGSVAVMISFPVDGLIPGSASSNEIKAMKEQLETAKIQRAFLNQSAAAEVAILINSLGSSKDNLEALELSIKVAEKNLELTREAYRAGLKDLIILQDAENSLQEAKQNVLKEKNNFLSILFDFEYSMNTEIIDG